MKRFPRRKIFSFACGFSGARRERREMSRETSVSNQTFKQFSRFFCLQISPRGRENMIVFIVFENHRNYAAASSLSVPL